MGTNFDIYSFDVKEYDRILACGLSQGLGLRGKQVCIEAAICQVLGLPHGDDPGCVAKSVRRFKIQLNDCYSWGSAEKRAEGLHDLGLAQLGSIDIVKDAEFEERLGKKVIQILIPMLFRNTLGAYPGCLEAATLCEQEGTLIAALEAALAAWATFRAVYAAHFDIRCAVSTANRAAHAAADYRAVDAAHLAALTATPTPSSCYLSLVAKLAVETLRELNSPGVALLEGK